MSRNILRKILEKFLFLSSLRFYLLFSNWNNINNTDWGLQEMVNWHAADISHAFSQISQSMIPSHVCTDLDYHRILTDPTVTVRLYIYPDRSRPRFEAHCEFVNYQNHKVKSHGLTDSRQRSFHYQLSYFRFPLESHWSTLLWRFKASAFLCKHSGDPSHDFNFHFAKGNVSIIVRLCDPVHLRISAKFNFYAPNWPHTIFSLRHFRKISVKIAMARPRSIPAGGTVSYKKKLKSPIYSFK